MTRAPRHVFCNGLKPPSSLARRQPKPLLLEWRNGVSTPRNINLGLPRFVDTVYHLSPRTLDLLEIATYVFAADRLTTRGPIDALEYHRWPRKFEFHIKVRDASFWNRDPVIETLRSALSFMTGDTSYTFDFKAGHRTPPANLFDQAGVAFPVPKKASIMLFSGGLDSLAGAVECLRTTSDHLCLVSHRSQPGTTRTQQGLADALEERFGGRILRFPFSCSLHGKRAVEETQRSRSFLYTAIAFAVASALGQTQFTIYENGFTALGLPERQDLMNARASRTTHPKTIKLLEQLFCQIAKHRFVILTPYLWNTKADMFLKLREHSCDDLITSSVSCGRTFQHMEQATHCGGCSQCIERRFAAYASDMEGVDSDSGIYASDFLRHTITDGDARTTVIDFIRLARDLATWNLDCFYDQKLSELTHVIDAFGVDREQEIVEKVWRLCQKHGREVILAVRRMRYLHDDVLKKQVKGSLLELVAQREHLKTPVERLVERLADRLTRAIPVAFKTSRPKNENVLNDQIEAILQGDRAELEREFPAVKFGLARTIPDHSVADEDLFIEGKYIRRSTSPSKATEGMAADLTKYPRSKHVLFVVYDPDRAIADDMTFQSAFAASGRCTVLVLR